MSAGGRVTGRILNCVPSFDKENDWTLDKAIVEGLVITDFPKTYDLREDWWEIGDQLDTSACVGWASTHGLLRWHLVKENRISKEDQLSSWLTWMAAKETDQDDTTTSQDINSGVCLKAALDILRKYGAVHEKDLPLDTDLFSTKFKTTEFNDLAAQMRIKGYYRVINNDDCNVDYLRMWISSQGPVLALVDTDSQWTITSEHKFEVYDTESMHGGHAVAIVGYTEDYFIVRNSWGTEFCDNGYVYCSNEYVTKAFCEAYGILL